MNLDEPSREQIESRITALLLGELPAAEAELLRWTIAQDAGLQKLHDELKSTIVLVREAVKPGATASAEKSAPLQLSDERRRELLACFKAPRPKPSIWLRPIIQVPRLVSVFALLAVIALLAAMLLPVLSASKSRGTYGTMHGGGWSLFRERFLSTVSSTREDAAANDAAKPAADEDLKKVGLQFRTWGADNSERAALAAAAPPATAPTSITVAPETVLAPPPASIILPQTESPSPLNSVDYSLAGSGKVGTLSQNIAGNANLQDNSSLSSPAPPPLPPGEVVPPAIEAASGELALDKRVTSLRRSDTESLERASQRSKLPAQASDAFVLTPDRNGGTVQNAGVVNAFAGTSGLRGQADSGDGADGFGGGGFAGNIGGATAPPPAKIISNGVVDQLGVEPPAAALNSPNSTTMAWNTADMNRSQAENPPRAAGHGFALLGPVTGSEEQRLPSISDAASEDTAYDRQLLETERKREQEKSKRAKQYDGFFVPPSDESPAANNPPVPQSGIASQDRETSSRKLRGITGADFNGQAFVSDSSASDHRFYRDATQPSAGNQVPAVGDVPVLGSRIKNSIAGAFQFATTNAVALRDGSFSSDSSPTPTLSVQKLQIINQQEEGNKNQPYDAAKRELEQKQRMHELLYSKLEAEKLDLGLPKSSMVQITDRAEPAKTQTAWQKLTGEFESKARMKVENDVNDIQGFSAMPPSAGSGYDPYFVQTTTEIIKSDAVLGKVVDALKLDQSWSKKNGGEKLTKHEVISQLKKRLDLKPVENTKLMEIAATSSDPNEAAQIANAVAKAYSDYRFESRKQLTDVGLKTLAEQYSQQEKEIQLTQAKVDRLGRETSIDKADVPIRKPPTNAPVPQPEVLTRENAFSTFSLNVSDVSFKLAAASLEKGQLPDVASIRSEEFINAFDYRDPEAAAGQPLAFASERARYPFAHNRDLLRFSVKTAAAGRQAGRALNLVLLLDNSGSMERADRVAIIREALRVLAAQLQPQDTVSVVTFARTARLWADGVPGDKAGETLSQVGGITPDGGTNLEEAMRLAYETARRHYLAGGMNRVVLLTDGAANLGNVDPGALKQKVEAQRRQGIALDCFGIGWEDFNDDLLEQLSGNGDGRYAFINSPEDAANDFAAKLAGALQVAAQDVKVQVEFNPQRVISWRQIGYAKHQLTKERFRDNSVIAAEIAAQEAGNALYTVETKPDGIGPIATVRVRYRVPNTQEFHERSWDVPYEGNAPALEQSSPAMRLAAIASAFSEWLAASQFAQEVTPDELLKDLSGVPEVYGADSRPMKLVTMIREAKSIAGN